MRKLIGLVLLVVALVGVDRGAAHLAGQHVADRIQRSAHLQTPPHVTVGGFPFLTQVVQGRYTRVSAQTSGPVSVNGLGVDRLEATVEGARVPLSALTGGTLSSVPVDHAQAGGHITWTELDRLVATRLQGQGLRLTFSSGGGNTARVRAVVSTPLGDVTVRGNADVSVRQGVLRVAVSGRDLQSAPTVVRSALQSALDRSFPLPKLPMGFTVTSAAPDATGLGLAAEASNTTLALP
ncbi:LmeA family phospholipid-binding protein [Oryzihumus sp.]